MPIVADAAARVSADTDPFIRDLKKLDAPVQSLGAKLKASLSPTALLSGAFAAGFAATKIVDLLGDSVAAASDFNETIAKTGQIFGDEALPALEEWAEGAAEAFGQSKQQALDAASTFAIFGKSAGLAGDDLVGFSQELVELSADFASFFNTSPEDAITAIGAALRGESEPIRRYGVLLDEATLRQRALKLGIIETTSQALTPQQRVLAAQAEILAQTSDAQGDFARTSDSLANQQRSLTAEMENAKIALGEELLPVVLELTQALVEMMPAVQQLIGPLVEFGRAAFNLFPTFGDLRQQLEENVAAAESHEQRASEANRGWVADWQSSAAAVALALEDGAGAVKSGATTFVSGIYTEVDKARRDAAAAAALIPGDVARAMTDNMNEIDQVLETLSELLTDEWTDAARIAYLEGQLIIAEEGLAAGMEQGDSAAVSAAQEAVDLITKELAVLKSNAYAEANAAGISVAEAIRQQQVNAGNAARDLKRATISGLQEGVEEAGTAGRSIGNSWINALTQALRDGWYAMYLETNRIRNLMGHSLPTEGPLQHPDRGGTSIGQAWAGALIASIQDATPNVVDAFGGITGALTDNLPRWDVPQVLPMDARAPQVPTGAVAPGGTVNNYNLHVSGRLDVDEAQDALDELRRLQTLSLRPSG